MAKSSDVMEENLFIVIEYRRLLSAVYIPQPARAEVFDPSVCQTGHIYCANAKRKPVQRMQMPSDGQTVYSGCAPERGRKRKDQPQSL